jgi:uncharacterized membrane protein SirB2
MAYALSGVALTIAFTEAYAVMTNSNIIPTWFGPSLAGTIIVISFGYLFLTRKRKPKIEHMRTTSHLDNSDEKSG